MANSARQRRFIFRRLMAVWFQFRMIMQAQGWRYALIVGDPNDGPKFAVCRGMKAFIVTDDQHPDAMVLDDLGIHRMQVPPLFGVRSETDVTVAKIAFGERLLMAIDIENDQPLVGEFNAPFDRLLPKHAMLGDSVNIQPSFHE